MSDCLFTILQVCLFDPSNIYVSAAYDYAFHTREVRYREEFVSLDPVRPTLIQNIYVDRAYAANDHARLTLGWTVYEGRLLTFDFGVAHVSSPSVEDHGYEAAYFGVTWKPFNK